MINRSLKIRQKEIAKLFPQVETIIDIGCAEGSFKHYFPNKKYVGVDIKNADIIIDLNKDQKLPFDDNSFDLIILSQILEHLNNPRTLISEAKRVSKKYILVGLPNEYTIDNRLRCLFGLFKGGFNLYGHKHQFSIDGIKKFISENFGKYEKKYYYFGVKGGRFLPRFICNWLAKIRPQIFSKEVFYLVNSRKFHLKKKK